jgi:hypothetical protein
LIKADLRRVHMESGVKKINLSVAICSFAIDVRSSWLVAAERLVKGVLSELPPFVEPGGVVEEIDGSRPVVLAACFAAFFARRLCFDVDGGMMVVKSKGR